jgi:RNA polymerase sigma-70 factor (ECF subfamily)
MKSHDTSPPLCYSALKLHSDEVLMAHLAGGNHDALAVLFDRYQFLVLRVSMQVLRDPHEAEDLLQSVFLELMRTASKFDAAKGTARVWILQCVYHRGFDRRRYLNRRGAYDYVDVGIEMIDAAEEAWNHASRISLIDSARLVQQALAQLSENQRRTIESVFFEGLTMHEIAAKTGESYAGVRHHYYRGLEKMRSVLRAPQGSGKQHEEGGEMAYASS